MSSFNPFGSRHYVRSVQADVNQICEPLFNKLDLNYFHYAIFYKDGSLGALYNRIDWHDCYYKNNFRTHVPLPKQQIQFGKYNLCLWQGTLPDEITSAARNTCNFDHPVGISVAHKDYFESFAFGTYQGNNGIINTYFNHIETLINFTKNFKTQAAGLIKKTVEHKVLLPEAFQAKQLNLLDTLSAGMNIKNGRQEVHVTLKEIEILRMLCRGLTLKEIANSLNRSTRTIETHLNNIKNKFGIYKKSHLISLMFDNNIDII